ncbi:MAG TPA: nuclear transport factor 2 family protein [Gemmatimonadaceae bacterium]|nr:nuclear transport factor 2 family protein [Gemmatimonadaceae bacterium]
MADRERVIDRITELFLATDRKDWPAVEACFAPDVQFDMSSVGAGPAARKSPREIADDWREGLEALEHVHHQAGNFVVQASGERATAFCYGIAYHYRARKDGRNTRVFVGSYDYELARDDATQRSWHITAMRFTLKFMDGNAAIEAAE